MNRVPTDEEILTKLKKRTVTHTVLPSGQHCVEIRWNGGFGVSGARHDEYTIALRAAFVGCISFLAEDERAQMLRDITPEHLHGALPAPRGLKKDGAL